MTVLPAVPDAAAPPEPAGRPGPQPVPRSVRLALVALLLSAGVMYAAGIPLGLIHNYYGPAVYTMAHDWRAWLFGAWDPAVSITLDKLPFAFQLQALSVRIFGWSDWAVLLPQVLEAVATIGVVFATVRRWAGPRAGLVAALGFATTPIVAALAHSQIVDTLLTLMLACAAYAWTRAVQSGRSAWLLASGAFVGLAFNAKMAEAWGVLPALALAYGLFAPGTKLRRLAQVTTAGLVTLAVSLWWLVVVSLVPASARPWIDGSASNSIWEMVFSYNLFSRYETGTTVPGREGGLGYLFSADVASQVGWWYPLALLGLVGALWWRRREPRTDLARATGVMSGLWLLTFGLAFSLGRVAHSFYVVALTPALVGLAALGLTLGWEAWRRGDRSGWALPAAVAATVAWTAYLQLSYPTFLPWITPVVVGSGLVALAGLLGARVGAAPRLAALSRSVAGTSLALALLLAPTAWAVSTTQRGWSGSTIGPAAGPAQDMGGGGGGPQFPGAPMPGGSGSVGLDRGAPGQPSGQPPQGQNRPPGQGRPQGAGAPQGPGPRGGSTDGAQTLAWLRANDPGTAYDAVVLGYDQAGALIEAGGRVVAVGGFTRSMTNLALSDLQTMVRSGEVHYVLVGGQGMGGGRSTDASELRTWVTTSCTPVTDAPVSGLYRCS